MATSDHRRTPNSPSPTNPASPPRRSRKKSVRRQRIHRVILACGFAIVLGVLGLVAAFAIGYVMTPIPDPNKLVTSNTTILQYDDGDEVLGTFAAQNRITVTLDQIPKHVQDAVLAAENRSFWTDPGISVPGMARAGWATVFGGQVQGGSTITQQYVKNYYLTQEQTISRKLNELFITIKIERQHSKAEILQNYLNTIYFGRGAYGIETAAQAYFRKSVHELEPAEGAVLASLARAPSNYDPAEEENIPRLEGRFRYVMDGLAEVPDSAITPEEAAKAKLPKIAGPSQDQQYEGPEGHLLRQVRTELSELGFNDQEIDAGGLRVRTTYNKEAQAAANAAMEKHFPSENSKGVHAGLAAVRPGTGEVVAMYGGPDYLGRSFNDATQAKFEPGSTFKIFALAAALENDVELTDEFAGNSGYKVEGGHEINNEGDRDYGDKVDLLEATEKSVNTAYVDLTVNELGPDRVADAAIRAGIPDDSPGFSATPLVALGNASVSPMDMANGVATFAAGGTHADWHVVDRVTTRTGEVLYDADVETTRAFDTGVVGNVTHALRAVVEDGTGSAAQAVDRPVAGKTGNHEGRTAWFAGYTPQLAASVGFYREDSEGDRLPLDGVGGMDAFTGGGYPTEIWSAFMKAALEGEPIERFPQPATLGLSTPTATTAPATVGDEPEPDKPSPSSSSTPTPSESPSNTPTPSPTSTSTPTSEPTSSSPTPPPPTSTPTQTSEPTTKPPVPTLPEPTETDDDPEPPTRRPPTRAAAGGG